MIDIIVIVFLLGSALYGYRKGLLKMLVSIVASVATILVSIVILPYINDIVRENTEIYPAVEERLEEQLEAYASEYLEDMEDEQQGNFIESMNLPKGIQKMVLKNNTAEYYKEQGISSFAQYLSKVLAGVAIRTGIFLITYIVVFILFRVICILAKILDHLPLIKEANHLSGMILCVAEALIVVWLVCLAATALSATQIGQGMNGLIQSSRVLQILYRYNPFMLFF